jgi:hypothetical protein
MKVPDWLPGVVLVLGICLITANFWYHKNIREGYDNNDVNLITYSILKKAAEPEEEKPPTDIQVAQNYRALLLFIKSDFTKGLQIVYDLNKRVYGKYQAVPDSFDPRKVLDDYKNPLTGI